MYKRTGIDNGLLVVGILMFILSICLYATAGALSQMEYVIPYANSAQFGFASLYLLTSILAIAAGVTGHKCPYISAIVISVLAIIAALGAIIIASLVAFTQIFGTASSTYDIYNYSEYTTVSLESFFGASGSSEKFSTLSLGPVIINGISFIMLIVLSSLSCCGGCCNENRAPAQAGTMYVTTTGGYTPGAAPPGYVGQPPQQYNFQGTGNPHYDQNIAMEAK
ncbi:uncharacterized protein [Watersipora subatra]|uniref:uncharacterized protein n=1 Tax=Watersipora subatra TaxID=2589382 RepID=UPI00355B964F